VWKEKEAGKANGKAAKAAIGKAEAEGAANGADVEAKDAGSK